MRGRLFVVLGTVLAVGAVQSAQAQTPDIRVGPELSFADDADLGIGARIEVGIPNTSAFVSGAFDFFFPGGDVDYWELNGNFGYGFPLNTTNAVIPYAIGGLNVAHVSSGPFSNTELGLNLGGGGRFPLQQVDLFFELRFEVQGGEQVVITGGVLF